MRAPLTWWILGLVVSAGPGPAPGALPSPEPAAVALLPVQDRAGDAAVARAVEEALVAGLGAEHRLVAAERLRDALRRGRIRNLDDAPPEVLRGLADELGAERLITAVVHLAERDLTPRVAASARSYHGATGALDAAAFESAAGLDGRTFLGLGVIEEPERLAAGVGRGLLAGLEPDRRSRREGAAASGDLPAVALVPLAGLSGPDATRAAETATEVVRSVLERRGYRVLPPNRTAAAVRSLSGPERVDAWGAVPEPLRRALRDEGAGLVVTGAVEAWEVGGDGFEPEPVVAVALRALDARTGRILWTGGAERRGWDRQGPFRLGRVYDRGSLAERIVEGLVGGLGERLAEIPSADDGPDRNLRSPRRAP
ncbi:MAG: hypothetical protein ACLF0P_00905 [Thermoanaerobaculia bacterium]